MEIGKSAFGGCSNLKNIFVDDNNQWYSDIEGVLFNKSKNILIQYPLGNEKAEYIIPSYVTEINDSAFSCYDMNSKYLESIVIPEGVVSIGQHAFSYSNSLKKVSIPESVASVGFYAFSKCVNLKDIEFKSNSINIDARAFDETSWYINQPDGVLYLGNIAYIYKGTMPQNTEIIIADGTTGINEDIFNNKTNLIKIIMPDSVINIGERALKGCYNLSEITFSRKLKFLGNNNGINDTAWYGKQEDGLIYGGNVLLKYKGYMPIDTSISIIEGTTQIGYDAFDSCYRLLNITLPDSITYIGDSAFKDCLNLSYIEVSDNNQNFTDINGILFSRTGDTLIKYPSNKNITEYEIPDHVIKIASGAFENCSTLIKVIIPESVRFIENNLLYPPFYRCYSLVDIIVDNKNETYRDIDGVLVSNEDNLLITYPINKPQTEYRLPDSVNAINNRAISYCQNLTSLIIPGHIDLGYFDAIYKCPKLINVTLENGIRIISQNVFAYCGLINITIPESVICISNNAFKGCSSLSNAYFLGDAPYDFNKGVFADTADDFIINYIEGKSGWTSPTWMSPSGEIFNSQTFIPSNEPVKLKSPTELTFKNGVAKWADIVNASSYNIQLYKDSIKVGDIINVAKGTTTYDFSSVITEAGCYTFIITAIGDSVMYLDSDEVISGEYWYNYYDINLDSNFNILDMIKLTLIINTIDNFTPEQIIAWDINNDGNIDYDDVIKLQILLFDN